MHKPIKIISNFFSKISLSKASPNGNANMMSCPFKSKFSFNKKCENFAPKSLNHGQK